MRTILTCAAALAVGALAWGAQQPAATSGKKATTVPKSTSGSAGATNKAAHGIDTAVDKTVSIARATGSAARKSASSVKSGASSVGSAARKSKKTPVKRTTWRTRQATPTPERYQEIQRALAARGYLPPAAASGIWEQASADALKRFQTEQNLDSTGKINSLSLIALGLGPRHDTPATKPADMNPGGPDR